MTAIYTNEFKRDLRKAQRKGLDISKLDDVVGRLLNNQPLEARHKYHHLECGSYSGCTDCHIAPDWVLIFRKRGDEIRFIRNAPHNKLFRM